MADTGEDAFKRFWVVRKRRVPHLNDAGASTTLDREEFEHLITAACTSLERHRCGLRIERITMCAEACRFRAGCTPPSCCRAFVAHTILRGFPIPSEEEMLSAVCAEIGAVPLEPSGANETKLLQKLWGSPIAMKFQRSRPLHGLGIKVHMHAHTRDLIQVDLELAYAHNIHPHGWPSWKLAPIPPPHPADALRAMVLRAPDRAARGCSCDCPSPERTRCDHEHEMGRQHITALWHELARSTCARTADARTAAYWLHDCAENDDSSAVPLPALLPEELLARVFAHWPLAVVARLGKEPFALAVASTSSVSYGQRRRIALRLLFRRNGGAACADVSVPGAPVTFRLGHPDEKNTAGIEALLAPLVNGAPPRFVAELLFPGLAAYEPLVLSGSYWREPFVARQVMRNDRPTPPGFDLSNARLGPAWGPRVHGFEHRPKYIEAAHNDQTRALLASFLAERASLSAERIQTLFEVCRGTLSNPRCSSYWSQTLDHRPSGEPERSYSQPHRSSPRAAEAVLRADTVRGAAAAISAVAVAKCVRYSVRKCEAQLLATVLKHPRAEPAADARWLRAAIHAQLEGIYAPDPLWRVLLALRDDGRLTELPECFPNSERPLIAAAIAEEDRPSLAPARAAAYWWPM